MKGTTQSRFYGTESFQFVMKARKHKLNFEDVYHE